jgi:hypothetical protein
MFMNASNDTTTDVSTDAFRAKPFLLHQLNPKLTFLQVEIMCQLCGGREWRAGRFRVQTTGTPKRRGRLFYLSFFRAGVALVHAIV